MTNPFADGAMSWPAAILLIVALVVVGLLIVSLIDFRKAKFAATQADDLHQLVHRFEQLAENTLDVQQRVAADLAELRSRAASIEQILRTVE